MHHHRKFPSPPAGDDRDAYLFIDHREDDAAIVASVSARLAPEDQLTLDESQDRMAVRHRGQAHTIPLQSTPQDRYILISSLAELLREHYAFFVLRPTLGTDTHGLLVVPLGDAAGWGPLPEHLAPLELGYDYFHGADIPYANQDPAARNAVTGLVQMVMNGKTDVDLAAQLVRLARTDPQLREAAQGKTDAELLAEISGALNKSFESPEFVQARRDVDEAQSNLRKQVEQRKAPWWKRKWLG